LIYINNSETGIDLVELLNRVSTLEEQVANLTSTTSEEE
jgi:hypothetical protein